MGRAAALARGHREPARGRPAGRQRSAARPETATTVRVRDGETELTDGPFAVTKEVLAGYYMLDVRRPRRGDRAAPPGCRSPATARSRCGRSWTADARPGGRPRVSAHGRPTPLRRVAAFRDERAAVLATLIRQVGDFQLAEDAVQDAFAAAVAAWPRDGVPANPGAWITVAARRRAIDRLRRDRRRPTGPRGWPSWPASTSRSSPVDGRPERDRRRPAAADLHLLPPGAATRRRGSR